MRVIDQIQSEERSELTVAVFVHEYNNGRYMYPVLVRKDAKMPSISIGGSEPLEDDPQRFADC